jgi:hypothetical protein
LLAYPTLALARPQAPISQPATATAQLAGKASVAEQTVVERRYNLPN